MAALRKVSRAAAAVLVTTAVMLTGVQAQPSQAGDEPYVDPSLPVADRVDDLLSRMTLDEKIGQMTQAERGSVSSADITNYRLGSVLSGGGSAPAPNTATGWADMYDRFQNAALATRLGIPLIYGGTDLATLNTLKASGVPIVVVLVSGRPLDVAAQLPDWAALVAAWLPGTEGDGVSDVLFGDYAPTGKLPTTWMRSAGQQPINEGDGKTPLFPFGYGLTYNST